MNIMNKSIHHLGIITAIDIEAQELREHITSIQDIPSPFFGAWRGFIGKVVITLVQSGAGKVCSAMATQWLIDTEKPEALFNVGIAGGLSEDISINTVILGTTFVQHDFMPAPWLGRKQGEIPFFGEASYPVSSTDLMKVIRRVIIDTPIAEGVILSGDEPIFDETRRQQLLQTFEKFSPIAVDMESASFAFTADRNAIPFAVIRTIADQAKSSNRPSSAGANAKANGSAALASQIVARFCEQY